MNKLRTSSCCDNGASCVEVQFVTSSYCGGESGCVEIAAGDRIRVRDTTGTVCTFTRTEWTAFIAGVKNNEFD